MFLPWGNPFKCHEEVLYFQPMIPPKCFDVFPTLNLTSVTARVRDKKGIVSSTNMSFIGVRLSFIGLLKEKSERT